VVSLPSSSASKEIEDEYERTGAIRKEGRVRLRPNRGFPRSQFQSSPTRRHADAPTRRHADTPTRRHADTPLRRHAPTPTRPYADTPLRRHADTFLLRHFCPGIPQRNRAIEDQMFGVAFLIEGKITQTLKLVT
jgi:hypothetical protein